MTPSGNHIKHLDVTPLILDLLQSHDLVIIKDFGAFVVNPAPAGVDRRKNLLSPPGKEVGFNNKITRNDGVLANEISRQWEVTYDEAVAAIEGFVAEIHSGLQKNGHFNFSGIGTLFAEENGSYRFSPEEKVIESNEAFGLEPFHLAPVQPQVSLSESPEKTDIEEKQIEVRYKTPAWAKAGWAVAALPFIIYLIWLSTASGVFDKNNDFQFSDLNPFRFGDNENYEPRPDAEELKPIKLEDILPIKKKAENPEEAAHEESIEPGEEKASEAKEVLEEVKPEPVASGPEFYIIAGSFKEETNAIDLVERLKRAGYDALLFEHGNWYRVSYGVFTDEKKTRDLLREIRQVDNQAAWMMRAR